MPHIRPWQRRCPSIDSLEKIMKNIPKRSPAFAAVAFGIAAVLSTPAWAAEIRVMCYQDGNECDVTKDLAKRFEAENKDVTVVVDTVPYKAITEQLPVQL